jgi:hypothetical protein
LNSDTQVTATFTNIPAVNTTPPTVAISAPSVGATVAGSSVVVSANASDNAGVVGVQFLLNGANLGAEVMSPPYNLVWNTMNVADASYSLTAQAWDAAGNTSVSAPINVTVSNGSASSGSGLVLHLDFDAGFTNGIVADTSGHGNDALNPNLTNPVVVATGKFGNGGFWGRAYPMGEYSLGPYLAVTNFNGFDVLTNGTVGVWAWCDTNSYQTTALIDAGYPGMTNSWSLRRYYNTRFELAVFCTNGSGQDADLLYFPEEIVGYPNYSTANWHHYCVTWQGNGPAVAYYDGVVCSTNILNVPYLKVGSYQHWLGIGCWHHNNSDRPDGTGPNNGWMGGRMDDIRIYNRALSAAEIQGLYASKSLVPPTGFRIIVRSP